MTYKGYNVVVVTPAGRKQYLEVLVPQILAYSVVDEYHVWVNTAQQDDIDYMRNTMPKMSERVKIFNLPPGVPCRGCETIHHFFKECVRPKTLYIRFDDDVVFLDTAQAFERFLDFRIENQQYFLVFPCIVNNAICSHILQRNGKLNLLRGASSYACEDPLGFKSGAFASNIHEQVAARNYDLSHFRTENWIFYYNEHVSINCIAWTGEGMMAACGGNVHEYEELDLTVSIPRRTGKCNVMFGGYCCVHYAFGRQRESGMGDDTYLPGYKYKSAGVKI
jgi:hypothetical protein